MLVPRLQPGNAVLQALLAETRIDAKLNLVLNKSKINNFTFTLKMLIITYAGL